MHTTPLRVRTTTDWATLATGMHLIAAMKKYGACGPGGSTVWDNWAHVVLRMNTPHGRSELALHS